jgi:hypothetical protein
MKVFADIAEWYVAENLEDAMRMQREHIGENPSPAEDWEELAPEAEIWIWVDEFFGDISDSGVLVIGTAEVWIEDNGPGFLCSTEY